MPYDTRDVVQRHVDSTAHILYETNLYPVPKEHIGQLVYVCVGPDRLEVFDRGVHAIAELERIPDGAGQIAASDRKRRGRYDVTLLQARLAAWGPSVEDFAVKLRRRKRTPGPELDHILKLQVSWSVDDIIAAIEHATKYDAFAARAVERILEARFRPRRLAEQIADATRNQIRDVQHLMLRKDVVAAVAEGKFHVHAVATADEALELVTGRIADVRDHDGHFPVGSVNAPVEARLLRFAGDVRRFAAGTERSAAASRFATGRRFLGPGAIPSLAIGLSRMMRAKRGS